MKDQLKNLQNILARAAVNGATRRACRPTSRSGSRGAVASTTWPPGARRQVCAAGGSRARVQESPGEGRPDRHHGQQSGDGFAQRPRRRGHGAEPGVAGGVLAVLELDGRAARFRLEKTEPDGTPGGLDPVLVADLAPAR